ncbi:MAG: sigma-54-dependent Fis family transcriptional regulator [Deltaproteobacteria bacterium]|nr:sigma-54-dependent Fis family transcriptional regulator [Deltaproteobacteria bacterium]
MKDHFVCIDDQQEVRELLIEILGDRGRAVHAFARGDAAMEHLLRHKGSVRGVLLDLDLGSEQQDGLYWLGKIREGYPDIPTVILTGKGSVETAVAAVQAGAADFIEKDPYLEDKVSLSIEKVERLLSVTRERNELAAANNSLRREVAALRRPTGQHAIVGESAATQAVLEKVVRVAKIPRPVLISGERGTGKELVAHAIHAASPRNEQPFVVVNCGAISESLLESELFGHEKGAFTGATQRKLGKFELAHEGTLFLDEIGNMSPEFQIKILRVVEYQRFSRVGGSGEIEVDVRVITATNADLKQAISAGTFRADLYDRLAFEVIHIPALRERKDDIPRLAKHFLARFRDEVSVPVEEIGAEALAMLASYDFPGNVRELKNIVERAVYAAAGEVLRPKEVEAALPERGGLLGVSLVATGEGGFNERVQAFERQLLVASLEATSWSQKDAAAGLELSYDQFRHMYRKYDLGSVRG